MRAVRSKQLVTSRKPSIADRNEAKAFDNLNRKYTALQGWLVIFKRNDEVNRPFYEKELKGIVPLSIRMFNLWDSKRDDKYSSIEVEEVHRNSNLTLQRYPVLLSKIKMTITELKEIAASRSRGTSKGNSVRLALTKSEKMRLILEQELIELRSDIKKLKDENFHLIENISRLKNELRSHIDRKAPRPISQVKIQNKASVTKIKGARRG